MAEHFSNASVSTIFSNFSAHFILRILTSTACSSWCNFKGTIDRFRLVVSQSTSPRFVDDRNFFVPCYLLQYRRHSGWFVWSRSSRNWQKAINIGMKQTSCSKKPISGKESTSEYQFFRQWMWWSRKYFRAVQNNTKNLCLRLPLKKDYNLWTNTVGKNWKDNDDAFWSNGPG